MMLMSSWQLTLGAIPCSYITQQFRLVREEPRIQIIGFCGCLTRQCREATICWIMAERL